MMRTCSWAVVLCCLCGWGVASSLAADARDTGAKTKAKSAAKAGANDRSKDPTVNAWYDRLLDSYMKADWEEFKDQYKQWPTMRLKLAPRQRNDVVYMINSAKEFRPAWWKNTASSKNTSFKAQIWGRWFTANYIPSETLGMHQPVQVKNNRLITIVSWRPTYVDNTKPFTNDNSFYVYIPEAKDYDFKLGTMGEVIVWHELGHNYISLNLPLKHVITLYNEYGLLYSHLQEFYADLTALYHSSPPGRLFTMRFRLMGLVDYDESNVHTRSCSHAVGALLLANILEQPDKWPSVHFPGKVPEDDVEQMTIFYVFRHISPDWTLAEDRQMREFIGKWIRGKGEAALRQKGRISLPNGQTMMILASEDRQLQRKRDQWIKRKLETIIESGRADKPEIFEKDMKDIENAVRWTPTKKLNDGQRGRVSRRANKTSSQKQPGKSKPDKNQKDILGDEKD